MTNRESRPPRGSYGRDISRSEDRTSSRFLVSAAAAVVIAGSPLAAQAPVVGTIRDGATGKPVAGAVVAIDQFGLTSTTDRAGRYRLVVPGGTLGLAARKIGYVVEQRVLTVVVADTIRLDLDLTPVAPELPELIAAAAKRDRWRAGFYQRMETGIGQFITEEELRRAEHRSLASVITERIIGVQVGLRNGRSILQARGQCPMAVYQDGLPIYRPLQTAADDLPPDLNQWQVRDLRGVEVYRSATHTPLEFSSVGDRCGTLVLWTRVA